MRILVILVGVFIGLIEGQQHVPLEHHNNQQEQVHGREFFEVIFKCFWYVQEN